MTIERIKDLLEFGENLPEGVDPKDTTLVCNNTLVVNFLLLKSFEQRIGVLEQALLEIYELSPGSYGYDATELASARWEIAAKALGKL